MNNDQVVIILAGFLSTLLGVVVFYMRWAAKRMDVKDERYFKTTKEDRDEFLKLTSGMVENTETRAVMFYETAGEFNKTASLFNDTIREHIEKSSTRLEDLSMAQSKWRVDWDAAESEDKKEHVALLDANREVTEYHKTEVAQRELTTENLRLIKDAMEKVCSAFDITMNGKSKEGK